MLKRKFEIKCFKLLKKCKIIEFKKYIWVGDWHNMEIIEVMQSALVPVVIISASALISLSIQQRYGRIIDRIRFFHEKLMEETEEKWRENINEQLDILINRGRLLRNSMIFIMVCIFFALLSTFLLSAEIIFSGFSSLVIISFLVSLFSLFISIIFALTEIFISYNAVIREDERIGRI